MRPLFPVLLFVSLAAVAQDAPPPPDLQPVPGGVPDLEETLEPEVTIRRRGEDVIEEYRIGGRLYMVKITPQLGPPYYLVDGDGDGNLETRFDDLDTRLMIPSWIIFSW